MCPAAHRWRPGCRPWARNGKRRSRWTSDSWGRRHGLGSGKTDRWSPATRWRTCRTCWPGRTGWSGWTSPPGTTRPQQVLADVFCFHPLAIKDCIAAQSGAEGPRVPRLPVPGAARAGRRQGRARALHRTRPVRRPELPGHGARTDQPGGRPGGDDGRGRVAAAPSRVGPAASRPPPTTCPTRWSRR